MRWLYLKTAKLSYQKPNMLGAPLVYFYVASSQFVFHSRRLVVPQLRYEFEGTPRLSFAADAALPLMISRGKEARLYRRRKCVA